MNQDDKIIEELELLRAENALLRDRELRWRQLEAEMQSVTGNLNVHQEELRSQNEELAATHKDLERAYRKYQNLYELSPVGFVTLDAHGVIVECNDAFSSFLGRDKRYLTGKPLIIYLVSSHHGRFFAWLGELFSESSTRKEEVEFFNTKGRFRAELTGKPLPGGEGESSRCQVAVADVTAWREALIRLKRNENMLRDIVEGSHSGICITDEFGIFEFVNASYCRIYGYEPKDFLGRSFTMVVPEAHKTEMQSLHDRFIAGEKEVQGEWPVKDRSGREFYIQADAARIEGLDGRPKKATFVTDITLRKEAERLKDDVDRMMRHDLRSPLQGLIHLPDFVADEGPLNDTQLKYLKMIKNAAMNMLHMINFSFDLYKIEQGVYDFQPKPLSIMPLLAGIRDEILARPALRNLSMVVEEPGPDVSGRIMGEELLCRSLFYNLMLNAAEAAVLAKGDVLVRLKNGEESGLVVIVDNAGEVPASVRSRFFDKYVTEGKAKGIGLGTYMARLATQTHGGAIALGAAVSGRTHVEVCLPAAVEDGERQS